METTSWLPELEFTEFPWAILVLFFFYCFLPAQFASFAGKRRLRCYKDMLYNKQAYIWQVLTSAEQAVTLEGVDWNVAALSELRGKYWLQRPFFFVQREKSIFQSPSQGFWRFFVSLLFIRVPAMWNRLRVTPGENELMPNFFIYVLQPRVVPPNQYAIHKYPGAPCSRQSGDESLRVSQLHTTRLRERSVF